jgi:Mg2+/Co2+ transporter CorC
VVTGAKDLEALLRELREHRQHLAIVVNGAGAPEGNVTMEDVVGVIEDEFDGPAVSVDDRAGRGPGRP